MRVALATVATPFLTGGAEALTTGLGRALVRAGHEVDVVTMPFRFGPPAEVMRAMEVWRGEDLTSLTVVPDKVICLKFPAYALQHPDRVLWLAHQYRAVYDLWPPSCGEGTAERAQWERLRVAVKDFDDRALAGFARRYTIGARVSERLREHNGLDSTVLWPPPLDTSGFYCAPAESYVFLPSRLEGLKRQALLIEAMRHVRSPLCALLAGEGGLRDHLEERITAACLGDRVRLLGHVSPAQLRSLYAMSLGVVFPPRDEDFGYVTIEAMLSAKPVITTRDAGGPLDFVLDGETGLVVDPDPVALAGAIDELWRDRERARAMGEAGRERYARAGVDWGRVVEALLA